MKKRIFSILLAVCMVLTLLGFTQPAMAAGEGTGIVSNGEFALDTSGVNMIYNADQLAYLAYQVNNNIPGWNTASYKMMNDINLSNYPNWEPIGNSDSTKNWPQFKGTFDGGGYTISNLQQNKENGPFGLFNDISNWQAPGVVRNIVLTNVQITASNVTYNTAIGALTAYNKGTIENCSVAGTISATSNGGYAWVGGIAGRHWVTVQNCYSTANVSLKVKQVLATTDSNCGGGIVGQTIAGAIDNCYATGSVTLDSVDPNSKVGAIIGSNSNSTSSNCYWLSGSATAGVEGGGTTTNICSFSGTDTLTSPVTIGGTSYSSLLGALNARVNELASTTLKTWVSSGSYPVFSTLWTPPTYTATVTVQKDGSLWSDSGKSFALCKSGTKKYDLSLSASSATVSALPDTYDIYDGASDTGVDIVVSSGGGTATVNYYTLTLSAGTGTSAPTGSGVYLADKSIAINATVNAGYQWSKWTSNNTTLLSDQATKSTSIEIPAAAITLTATATPIQYSITYTMNGGTALPANPTSYTVESATITLNTPTRSDYSFLGWTGSNGTTAQTSVSISGGSTGDKVYTANWKANAPASAPDNSIVMAKTDKSLTITTQTGYEYSMDNGAHWYSSATGTYTFNDLDPETVYSLVCRKAAVTTGDTSFASEMSGALSVTTKKASASVSVPAAPTIGTGTDKPSSNGITIGTVLGSEYYISNSAIANWSGTPNGYFKATVDGTHKFDGLDPTTQYYIHFRVAETENAMPSASSNVSQYTLPETPAASTVSINYATETISFANTYEVSASTDFNPTIPSGNAITSGTTYYVRVAANGGVPASEAISFAVPARPDTPTAITVDKTKNSITIIPVAGQEYKIGSGTWQVSGSFTGLSADTDYTVYARVKAVSSGSVSFASEAYATTIKTKADGSVSFALPTISVAPTYTPGKTLNDVTLPAGWVWSAPATIPTVTNSGYSAVYTPTDAATVDYYGIEGYAVDGDGKVTITRTVPLTVNRATPTAADFTYTAPAALDYNGTAKTAAVNVKGGISGMGTVTVRYFLDGVETVPTNAGIYTVKITLAQGDNYAAATDITDSAWTFTIAKVSQAPLSITGKPASVTYGDTFTLATSGSNGTGALTWAVTSGSSATVNVNTGAVTITGVGETTITATKAADGNYSDTVTDTYTVTPAKRLITVDVPSAIGGWTKVYDGDTGFNTANITVGSITNKVGTDVVNVSVQTATYDTTTIGDSNKTLTLTYAIEGASSGYYLAPADTIILSASVTAATPTITLVSKISIFTLNAIEIAEATITGVTGGTTPSGAITYTYYTEDTCTEADKTTAENAGAETIGGAPKKVGTYYVKAKIAANGNYAEATSTVVTLTIYKPSSGQNNTSGPVIVDGKTVDMGTAEVNNNTTTVVVDQNKMMQELNNAKDSVVIPVTATTDTAAVQLVVKNVESMAERGVSITMIVGDVSYSIPSGAIDTSAALKALGASDSSKVPLNITISKLFNSSITIQNGTLMVPPVAFSVTATYNGISIEVERFGSYVQRVIAIPDGTDPKTITTAVVVEADGSQRHVPTEVYSENGKWYAKINALTNSTYALIQNSVSFTDTQGKWYDKSVTEMASREIIGGIGKNMFAGERAITRAEFAAIIVRAMGLPTNSTAAGSFNDVRANQWYYGAVGTAYEYGLVTGKGKGQFDPNANITRQEAMVIMARAAKLAGYAGKVNNIAGFSDVNEVGAWALDAVKFNVGSGFIVGNNSQLRPTDKISRAETAAVVLRLLQNSKLIDVRN